MNREFKLPILLDGATGTNLMLAGMPQGVCVEQWIIEHPETITELQKNYVRAGSNAVMAPTFEANRIKLKDFGLGDQVEEINRRLVELSRKAVGDKVLVAGNMAPVGIFVEPFGDATFEGLMDIYREQAFALKKAGADYIAIETMMSLTEARAALLAAKETGLPVTVSLTVDQKGRTLAGGDVTACLVTLSSMGAAAVGLNCSTGPDIVLACLKNAAPHVHVPLIAKPNAGLPSEDRPGVYDIEPSEFAAYVPEFMNAGAGLIGGCCGTTPEHIARMHDFFERTPYTSHDSDDGTSAEGVRDFFAADERHIYLIEEESIDFSHKIDCDSDLADRLIALSDDAYMAARIRIRNKDDAHEFGMNAYLVNLPVVLLSDDPEAMDIALRLYQGRALIDSKSDIPAEMLGEFSKRYGAVVI